jgi:hypothetical protein
MSASHNLKAGRRVMPTTPTQIDVRPHVRRLLRDPDASTRRKAAITLVDVNNPAAMAGLAQAFMIDPSPEVCEIAEQSAKLLYWNLLYYEMEQNGTIAREIQRRKALLTPDASEADTKAAPPRTSEQQKIEDLLRRGREKRNRR